MENQIKRSCNQHDLKYTKTEYILKQVIIRYSVIKVYHEIQIVSKYNI